MGRSDDKIVVKNSVFLFLRMLFNLLITFYSSRIVLNSLGINDFGIYSVVGGLVAMFGVLNGSMATTTSRFFAFEIGDGNLSKLRKTFSGALIVNLCIALIVLIFSETIGLWWVENKLNIPPDRLSSATYVYHFSVLTLLVTVVQVPFNAIILAYEKMKMFSFIEIVTSFLKFSGALLLMVDFKIDNLVFYSSTFFVASFIMLLVSVVLCYRVFYPIINLNSFDAHIVKPILNFSFWDLFGNIANMARIQGSNILLNLQFGLAVNAAYSISNQIYGATGQLVNSFQFAINPRIVKSYATGDTCQFRKYVFYGSRFSFFILLFAIIPVIYNVDYVLTLWLSNPPSYANVFTKLILIDTLLNCLSGALVVAAKAPQKIKYYQIVVSFLLFINVPLSYLFFNFGYEPEILFVIRIVLSLFAFIYRIGYVRHIVEFTWKQYFHEVIAKVLVLSLLVTVFLFLIEYFYGLANSFPVFVFQTLLLEFFLIVSVFYFGLKKKEKVFVFAKVKAYVYAYL